MKPHRSWTRWKRAAQSHRSLTSQELGRLRRQEEGPLPIAETAPGEKGQGGRQRTERTPRPRRPSLNARDGPMPRGKSIRAGSREKGAGPEVDTIAEETATDCVVKHLLGGSVTKAEVAAAIRAASGK